MSLLGNFLKIVLHDRTRVGIGVVLKTSQTKTRTYMEIESGPPCGSGRLHQNDPQS